MFFEHIRLAVANIRNARFRSFFTMMGIIIAVVSVITIVSLGEGIKKQISGQANNAGADLITVRPGKLVNRDAEGQITGVNLLSFFSSSSIDEQDYKKIKDNDLVETVVPLSFISGAPSIPGKQLDEGFLMATTGDMPSVAGQKVEFGNFFDEGDKQRNVAVIGQGVAEKLFEENVPISKTIQLRGQEFTVSGVLEKSPPSPLDPQTNFNNGVFIPYDVANSLAGGDLKMYEILVRPKSKDAASIDKAIASIAGDLKSNHANQEDFTILKQEEMTEVAGSVFKLVNSSVTLIAAIALFVGGIGIMNIMLVSVSERTKEIGIRKAVGATNYQIHQQFLTEAIVISLAGAFIGIIISGFINLMFRVLTHLEPVITWEVVAVSAVVSVFIGMIFGTIPAVKAAKKDPIDALRSY